MPFYGGEYIKKHYPANYLLVSNGAEPSNKNYESN
jgi:hypothetical protein